jgi:hypothetical protein
VRFGTGILYKNCRARVSFVKIASVNHALLTDVNEFIPTIPKFLYLINRSSV